MKRTKGLALVLGAAVCLTISGQGFAQSPSSAGASAQTSDSTSGKGMGSGDKMSAGHSKSMADQKFAHDAAAGGAAEVEMGKLASDKATNPKVKEFGQRMVTDHGKAGDELKSLASKKGMTLPDSPDPKSKAMMSKMSALSGAAFDKAYMQDMVKDHQKDVAEFQKEANSGADPDLKSWAGTTLPVLQEHLRMAKEALSAVNGGSPSSSK